MYDIEKEAANFSEEILILGYEYHEMCNDASYRKAMNSIKQALTRAFEAGAKSRDGRIELLEQAVKDWQKYAKHVGASNTQSSPNGEQLSKPTEDVTCEEISNTSVSHWGLHV